MSFDPTALLETQSEFAKRHIGPNPAEEKAMLAELGFSTLEEMAQKVIPKNIRSTHSFVRLGKGLSEHETLVRIKGMMSKNQVFKSFIGLGFHDTLTPTVIQRNILENPVWYTAYTPYQPEIAQGRLEALLNFQTMVTDLTGMEISNASLLDEGSAAAEAMAMAHALVKNKATTFLASPKLHPHVLDVLKTRSEPLGLKMLVEDPFAHSFSEPLFAVIVAYPDTDGQAVDFKTLAQKAHDKGAMMVADVDLLALTLLTPPGEWGADIVVGNSQRFGVPLGNGGPHAAFLATKDAHKRLMPGRLVGVSVDSQGKQALRLTLQTREQHIRREKATSNICTAQVLLANMASMYAVYHGPQGLKKIASRVHLLTQILAAGLKKLGHKVSEKNYFDTLHVETDKVDAITKAGHALQLNFRTKTNREMTISLNETTDLATVDEILTAFNLGQKPAFTAESLKSQVEELHVDAVLKRTSPYLTHPVFNRHHSESEMLRYIHTLQNKDLTLTHSMIPLGSCTMKLNATTELVPVSWPEVNRIHPFAPLSQMQGYAEMVKDLEEKLCDLTGFAAVSLRPNSGAQGEYAGLLVIRKYHQSKGQGHRKVCLIPSSAHGTNPASAVLAGMDVVVVACDDQGNVDVKDLKAKAEQHKDTLAALMITYPSTHGVFEESIREICQIVHANGGQVYMDGANLNALVGLCRPGEFGPDVSHMNLHKTFSIPHGGGGPGVGPIGVGAHLKPFLDQHVTSAPWGSASILPISWSYITMMGAEGLKHATLTAILSANYIAKKLDGYYPVLYKGREGMVAHECIIDLRPLKKNSGIDVNDVAKRLMDYGFHSPTMSWPVAGTLMIEPTESEPKAELDRFIDAMLKIRQEIQMVADGKMDAEKNPLRQAPHTAQFVMANEWTAPYSRETAAFPVPWLRANKYWPAVGRVDNAYGDRNVVCACPPLEEYQ
jgi:glycine dehydrogenase